MLEIQNLAKAFTVAGSENKVISGLSFTVKKGDFYIIVGPSGCGKSTLLRMIGGFEQPDEGAVWLAGRPVKQPSKDMMMVFQNFEQLFPWFTLKQNLIYGVKKVKLAIPDYDYNSYVMEYLEMAGLAAFSDNYPHQLSGGMKQRGALARALCVKPDVLLMDEPFSSLDYITKQGLYQSVREMVSLTGATVMMVTHDIEEALLLGTTISVLTKGSSEFSAVFEKGDGFGAEVRNQLLACLKPADIQ